MSDTGALVLEVPDPPPSLQEVEDADGTTGPAAAPEAGGNAPGDTGDDEDNDD